MVSLKKIWLVLLLCSAIVSPLLAKPAEYNEVSSKPLTKSAVRREETILGKKEATINNLLSSKEDQYSNNVPRMTVKKHTQAKELDLHNAEFQSAFKHESLHPTIVTFPLIYGQMFGTKKDQHKASKLFIHKFGNLRNLISQKQWIEIQAIFNQKTPLRAKHFEISKILNEKAKFKKSQIQIFWNDFFDFHVMKKVLMLHNKILQSFGQKSIENYGIYDVDISVATKVKLLNAQIKRYLPQKDYDIYLKIQSKVFELSKSEKEALLL